jgi:hypothetical protein
VAEEGRAELQQSQPMCLQDSAHCRRSDGVQSRMGREHSTCAQTWERKRYSRWECCGERIAGVVGVGLTGSAGLRLQNPGLEKLDHSD